MTPTSEEVKRVCEQCGGEVYELYYLQFNPKQLQAFAQHYIEVGRKEQRERDAQIAYPKNDKSDWTLEAEHAALIAELIRNNTGE